MPHLKYSERNIEKNKHLSCGMQQPILLSNFFSLTSSLQVEALQETKMENIAVKCLLFKRPKIYLCHATQFTTNIFCGPSPQLMEKKSITPTLLLLSITHGNLNCHNKVFFQDVSSNSLSLLLKWLSRASHKSRRGIVIQNRWTLNHR